MISRDYSAWPGIEPDNSANLELSSFDVQGTPSQQNKGKAKQRAAGARDRGINRRGIKYGAHTQRRKRPSAIREWASSGVQISEAVGA